MKNLIIVKLGGSVITDKSKNTGTFKKQIVKRLVAEIKQAQLKKNFDLIIVHGAGSFGHPIAKKYFLKDGLVNKNSVKGMALCRVEMAKLKQLLLKEFIDGNLNADIVDTSSIAITENDKIFSFDLKKIISLLKLGVVPFLSGDVVIDKKKGISILSGDKIAPYLASKLNANRIIYVSDVGGVYDKNPQKFKDAKLIVEINKKNYRKVIKLFEGSGRADVTGEMGGKIMELMKNLNNCEVELISGLRPNFLRLTILGRRLGTSINFQTKTAKSII